MKCTSCQQPGLRRCADCGAPVCRAHMMPIRHARVIACPFCDTLAHPPPPSVARETRDVPRRAVRRVEVAAILANWPEDPPEPEP
jgi:hypothetical protein